MKTVICIKDFSIEMCDEDGFTIENKEFKIDEGTIWEVSDESFRVAGGEVRLTRGLSWIEISNERFKEYFA